MGGSHSKNKHKHKYLFVKNANFGDSSGLYYRTKESRDGKPVYKMMNNHYTRGQRYIRYGPKSGWYIGPQIDDYGYFFADITLPKTSAESTTNAKGLEIRPVADAQLYEHDKHTFQEVITPAGDNTDCSGVYRKTSMEYNSCPVYKMVGTSHAQQTRFLQYAGKQGWSIGPTLQSSQCHHSMQRTDIVPWADTWTQGGVNVIPTPEGQLPETAQVRALGNITANDASRNLFSGSLKDCVFDRFKPLPDPQSATDIEITFKVYAHHILDTPVSIPADKVSYDYLRQVFTEEHYNYENARTSACSNLPTFFIVHGFCNTVDTEWMETTKEALVTRYNFMCNVIKVGWGKGAEFPHYPQAVANTQTVASAISTFVNTLVANDVVQGSNIHLVGHSLGAHICGQAGRKITPNLSRVTGLDPAGPFFEKVNQDLRLSPDSAPFVDVIHTHGYGSGVDYGTMEELGHVDFYPNGGKASQPGCKPRNDLLGSSHGRAYDYFNESITALGEDAKFWGDSENGVLRIPMGFHVGNEVYVELIRQTENHGRFFLDTSDEPHFSLGLKGPTGIDCQ